MGNLDAQEQRYLDDLLKEEQRTLHQHLGPGYRYDDNGDLVYDGQPKPKPEAPFKCGIKRDAIVVVRGGDPRHQFVVIRRKFRRRHGAQSHSYWEVHAMCEDVSGMLYTLALPEDQFMIVPKRFKLKHNQQKTLLKLREAGHVRRMELRISGAQLRALIKKKLITEDEHGVCTLTEEGQYVAFFLA